MDATRRVLQHTLDRVEDLLDLKACTAGVTSALESADLDSAALCIKRFHGVARVLPVPAHDVALMQAAEASLMDTLAALFDAAISRAAAGSGSSGSGSDATIARCCGYMSLLGHASMGVDRYTRFACAAARADMLQHATQLVCANGGVDAPVAACNALGAMLAAATTAYGSVDGIVRTLMGAAHVEHEEVVARVRGHVVLVVDAFVAMLLRSVVAGARVRAALSARHELIAQGESGADAGPAPAWPEAHSAADVATILRALDAFAARVHVPLQGPMLIDTTRGDEAPLAVAAHEEVYARVCSHMTPFETVCDETALQLQRCASFHRVVAHMRMAALVHTRLKEAAVSLCGVFASLTHAYVHARMAAAVAADSLCDDPSTLSIDIATDPTVASETGAGACTSTVCEDAVFVCVRALKRACATGYVDAFCATVNVCVAALTQRLAAELEGRIRSVMDDGSATSSSSNSGPTAAAAGADIKSIFGMSLSPGAASRVSDLTRALMSSTPVRVSAARMAAFAQGGVQTPPRAQLQNAPSARLSEETAAVSLALNNVHVSAACVARLEALAEKEAKAVFTDERDHAKLRTSLAGIMDLSSSLKTLCDSTLRALAARLTPRIRTALHVYDGASALIAYDVEDDGSVRGDAFTSEFMPVIAAILAPYQYALLQPLAIALASNTAGYIAKQLELRVRRKRFTMIGALQFDAHMRSLVAFFVTRCGHSVRARFQRLLQAAQLLLVEAPADVLELPALIGTATPSAAGVAAWELSADDVRSILSLRRDFTSADVARLKLPAHL